MLPVYLKMTNFLSYENEEFDFSKISCATVTGENGAGKSSFCTDAITFALYGIGSKGGIKELDNYVRKGADSGTVEFTFDLGEDRYKIVRTRSVTKSKTSLSFFTIGAGETEIPLGDGKINSTQALIESTLHMNYRTFASTAMIAQGKSSMFTEGMTDNERKEALIEIMDIDSWGIIGAETAEKIRNTKAEIRSLQSLIDSFQAEDIEQLKAKGKMLAKREAEQANIVQNQKDILEKNQEAVYKQNSIQLEMNEILTSISEDKQTGLLKKKQLDACLGSRERILKEIDDLNRQKESLQSLVKQREKIEQDYKELQDSKKIISELEQKQLIVLQQNQKLQEVIQNGKNWNSEHESTLRQIAIQAENCEKQTTALAQVPCAGNADFTGECKFLSMARQAELDLLGLREKKAQVEAEKNPYRSDYISAKKDYDTAQEGFSAEILDKTRKKVESLNSAEQRMKELEAASQKETYIDATIKSKRDETEEKEGQTDSLKSEMDVLRKRIEKAQEKLDQKRRAQEQYKSAVLEYGKAKAGLDIAERTRKEIELEMFRIKARAEQAEKAQAEYQKKQEQVMRLKDELTTQTLLYDACSKKSGVPAFIIENAIPEIEEATNEMLDRMTDGKLILRFSMQEDAKTTKSVQEVLRIKVSYYGVERDYETFSGAEKFIIDLSIRIALSKFLSHRAGTNMQLFVLDEGVSCADDTNREEIMDAIRSIAGEFKKILFVTHITELKDIFEQKIIVTKNSHGSHIKVA